jgi:NADPH:quinone reductase-like Zn-dependent oxidoreductase
MMRAYTTVGDGIAKLKRVGRPVPEPKDDEVLVSMRAASLNYRDLLVVKGVGRWKPPTPRVPLSDGAGVVVAAGGRVSRWKVGDRVTGVFMPRWLDGELTAEKDTSPSASRPSSAHRTASRTRRRRRCPSPPSRPGTRWCAAAVCGRVRRY